METGITTVTVTTEEDIKGDSPVTGSAALNPEALVDVVRTCVVATIKSVSARLLGGNDGDWWHISSLELKGIANVKPKITSSAWIEMEKVTIYPECSSILGSSLVLLTNSKSSGQFDLEPVALGAVN